MNEEANQMQGAVLMIDSFLDENYQFRRNVLSGKTEVRKLSDEADRWSILTEVVLNSIVRKAKMVGFDEHSPRTDIVEFVGSDAVKDYDPIRDFLENLPEMGAFSEKSWLRA